MPRRVTKKYINSAMQYNNELAKQDNLQKVSQDYSRACGMSCTPGPRFRKVKKGEILDEEKSVRWNREESERLNNEYLEEVKRLNREKNAAITSATNRAIHLIAAETGLSEEKAKIFWDFVYDKHHSCIDDLFNAVDEYIFFFWQLTNN